jgi:hypothetical protein
MTGKDLLVTGNSHKIKRLEGLPQRPEQTMLPKPNVIVAKHNDCCGAGLSQGFVVNNGEGLAVGAADVVLVALEGRQGKGTAEQSAAGEALRFQAAGGNDQQGLWSGHLSIGEGAGGGAGEAAGGGAGGGGANWT